MPLTEALQRLLQSFKVKQSLPTRNLGMRICIPPAVTDQLVELRTTWIQEASQRHSQLWVALICILISLSVQCFDNHCLDNQRTFGWPTLSQSRRTTKKSTTEDLSQDLYGPTNLKVIQFCPQLKPNFFEAAKSISFRSCDIASRANAFSFSCVVMICLVTSRSLSKSWQASISRNAASRWNLCSTERWWFVMRDVEGKGLAISQANNCFNLKQPKCWKEPQGS